MANPDTTIDTNAPTPALPGLMVPNLNGTSAAVQALPLTHTTRRAFASASFCLGLWGALTFWMYPFGMCAGAVGVAFGVISVIFGIRAGGEGQHLAWAGIVFGSVGVGTSILIFRLYQLAFEGGMAIGFLKINL